MGRQIDYGEIVARRKLYPLPESWKVSEWERIGPDAVRYKGGITRPFAKGPRKGQPHWFTKEYQECVVLKSEMEAEKISFEKETGKCWLCGGDGQEWRGWNRETGEKFETCRRCNGTGVGR